MRLSGTISTTVTGLSEGIFWNFKEERIARELLEHYGIPENLLPEAKPSFSVHAAVSRQAAAETGFAEGTPIAYKAGDQPNNAFSLNVLHPGEMAATAGTSGVMYSITDKPDYDQKSRVNTFVHVNHEPETARYGVLLCVNGTGILNSWVKRNLFKNDSYSFETMNRIASQAPIGAEGLSVLPFGNGAERILENKFYGAEFSGLNLNRHETSHFLRAAQEGIVFALNYGFDIMKEMGVKTATVRAGHANMFLSPLFREAFVNTTGTELELYNTDGSLGAARGAGVGAGIYPNADAAFSGLHKIDHLHPDPKLGKPYREAYERWLQKLEKQMKNH
jgi:xylulokinase